MNKALRIIGIIVVIVLIIAAIIASMTIKPPAEAEVWDEQMTIGNQDAKNHFIVYSDLVCPYCIAFENAILEEEEEFHKYIEKNDILFEVRLSDFLYEYGEHNPINSRYSAVATYCAKDEGKFWDYYNLAIKTLWKDYFKDNGKSAVSKISAMEKDYWIDLGKQVGLGDDFVSCVKNDTPLSTIKSNAARTADQVNGLPAFKLNNYSPPGFSMDGTWEDVKAFFKKGLSS